MADAIKKNEAAALTEAYQGFAAMCTSVVETMMTIVKNTADDKLAEVVADEMVQERTRRKKTAKPGDKKPENPAKPEDKNPAKPEDKAPETGDEESEGSEERSRRNKK